MKIKFYYVRPGGNDTALVEGLVKEIKKRRYINDQIMRLYPRIEQVGFINNDLKKPKLEMAGGEFCGNATRSAAFLILKGKPGQIYIKVSGVKKKLLAGVTNKFEAFAQMPIYKKPRIINDPNNSNGYIVELEGITQYINLSNDEIINVSEKKIKIKAKKTINKLCLNKYLAAGVVYVSKNLSITPIVWVKKINTLFLETACGSATVAVGQILAMKKSSSIKNISIGQPSGLSIKVSVNFDGKKFGYAQIQSPIKILKMKKLDI